MSNNSISIIIPTTYASDSIKLCLKRLRSLSNVQCIGEVILVNNSSEDIDSGVLDIFPVPKVKVLNIHSKINSLSKSWNIGLLNKQYSQCLISNDDVVYSDGSIDALVRYQESLSDLSICIPVDFFDLVREYRTNLNWPESLRDFIKKNKYFSYQSYLLTKCLEDNYSIDLVELKSMAESKILNHEQIIERMYGSLSGMNDFWNANKNFIDFEIMKLGSFGSSFLMNDSIINKVGLFDENFSLGYCEDLDYKERCEYEGIQYRICPDSFVHHFACSTFKRIKMSDNIDFHKQNRSFLDEKRERYYRNIELEFIDSSLNRREIPFNLSVSDSLVINIDASKATKSGNVVCCTNIFGDPVYYIWLEVSDVVVITHGYCKDDGNWFNSEIYRGSKELEKTITIYDGEKIIISEETGTSGYNGDGNLNIPKIQSNFLTIGDLRNKTENTDAIVKIVEIK